MKSLPDEAICRSADASDIASCENRCQSVGFAHEARNNCCCSWPWRLSLISIRIYILVKLCASLRFTISGTAVESFGLGDFELRLRYAPAVAIVGTNSEIKVGEPMCDSSTPT